MKKINLGKQSKYLLIGLGISLILRLFLSPNFEDYTRGTLNVLLVVGIILFLISLVEQNIVQKIIDYVKIIYLTVLTFFLIQTYFIAPFSTSGSSMESTIKDGDILIARVKNEFERGDVVIVNHEEEDTLICKRVIGVAGDNVYFKENELYINGVRVEEPYLDSNTYTYDFSLADVAYSGDLALDVTKGIPEGYYLVLGDNREVSLDSRLIGLIKEENIYAKVFFDLSKFSKI